MSSPGVTNRPVTQDAGAPATAGEGGTSAELDALFAQARQERDARYREFSTQATAIAAARAGWAEVRTAADQERVAEQAREELASGAFLVRRLGGERDLDPLQTAVLLELRRRLVEEFGVETAAEVMVVDATMLSYQNLLRTQGWLGDAATMLEAQLFGMEGPAAKLAKRHGPGAVQGLAAEEWVARIVQQLMPAVDRANRGLLRNLKALRDLRGGTLALSVGAVNHFNIGRLQQNTTDPPAARRRRPPTPDRDADGREAGEVTP